MKAPSHYNSMASELLDLNTSVPVCYILVESIGIDKLEMSTAAANSDGYEVY